MISLIARGNTDNIENNNSLDRFDRQSLTAMLAQMEQMGKRISRALMTHPHKSTPPCPERVPATAEGEEAVNSQAARVEPEHAPPEPRAAEAGGKENLPSPAATEYVATGTQPDEEPKDIDLKPVTATIRDKSPDDVGLPNGLTREDSKIEDGDNATEPASDDKTAVEDQAMDVD